MPTAIEEKHDLLLVNGLDLGEPLGDEEKLEDGGSRQFYEFGRIYFHPRVGAAFECHGLILQRYIEMGEATSRLGYPVTDEMDSPAAVGARMNAFEDGVLLFTPNEGVTEHFFVPQVVVKISDVVPVNLAQGERLGLDQLAFLAGQLGGSPAVAAIAEILPDLEFRRAFDGLKPGSLDKLIKIAQADDPSYAPPNFENYLEIICPIGFDPDPLIVALNTWEGLVERAYRVAPTEDAGVVATTNPRFLEQEYLFSAPTGIAVEAAWAKGADGTGCRVIDVEHGWLLNQTADDQHEDLPQGIPLLRGINRRVGRGHGAAVLGVIAALDNSVGVVGIAPQADVSVISVEDRDPDVSVSMDHAALMIADAALRLSPGDVLLLEVQASGLPVELDPMVFHVINLATRCGIIVVEAAGNAGTDLDLVTDNGVRVLSRLTSEFRDSGAILVAACESDVPHNRDSDSNFGSRIDCYAWGEKVLTAGLRQDPVHSNDYFRFSGTSAASAIIAGVCLLMQHLQKLMTGSGPLTPKQMRHILSHLQNGTSSASLFDRIAVMPDFRKIIANEFL